MRAGFGSFILKSWRNHRRRCRRLFAADESIQPMDLALETEIVCPHCGESFSVNIDTSQARQTLIEDCAVCCRPMTLTIRAEPGEILEIDVAADR